MKKIRSDRSPMIESDSQNPAAHAVFEEQFFERSVAFNLRRSFNKVVDEIDAALAGFALSSHQFGVLSTIYYGRASTPSEVARLRFQNGAAITYTLDRLEQRGLLKRTRSEADKRVITLILTDDGRELTRKCMEAVVNVQDRVMKGVTAKDRDRLFEMLQLICEN